MTGAPASPGGAGARAGAARAIVTAVITVVTTVWGTLAVLAWLAGMIIRQSRAVRRGQTRGVRSLDGLSPGGPAS